MGTPNSSKSMRHRFFVFAAWTAVLVVVPAGFILSGRFTRALRSAGVGLHPNLDNGRLLAQGAVAAVTGTADRDLRNLRSFSIREVRFSPLSGMGIAPRLNLCFEFADRLADPHHSPAHFSGIAFNIFIGEANPKMTGNSSMPAPLPAVALQGGDWQYRVIVDGFHERPRIYDRSGRLVALGMGLYLKPGEPARQDAGKPRPALLTAALPAGLFEALRRKPLHFYLVAGTADSRHASMLLLDEAERLARYAALTLNGKATAARDPDKRVLLAPLVLPPR